MGQPHTAHHPEPFQGPSAGRSGRWESDRELHGAAGERVSIMTSTIQWRHGGRREAETREEDEKAERRAEEGKEEEGERERKRR